MSSAFERATAIAPIGQGAFVTEIPDGWQQGKGAFGGVVVGLLARAMLRSEPDPARRLRSLSASLCAPLLTGPAEIRVAPLRRGGSVSFLDARVLQGGALVAHGSAAIASAREVPPTPMVPSPPTPPAWADVATIPVEPPMGPVFARHYEYRSTGPLPLSRGSEARAEGWVREKSPRAALDAPSIAALLDAWWPTCLAVDAAPRAVVTLGFAMQLLGDPEAISGEEPLFYRARGVASSGSYFVEMRELWAADRLVALNQQTFAMLT